MKPIKLPSMDAETVCDEIGNFVIDTVRRANANGCVIGLSGGVDSSTSATLVNRAFAAYNRMMDSPPLTLKAFILPSSLNSADDTFHAHMVADQLGISCQTLAIEGIVNSFQTVVPSVFEHPFHKGNMISRVRANVLSTLAAIENKIVVGTGNRDEDFGIGYYTLFGDGAVHISPIGGLPKRLVRQMASWLALPPAIVSRTPTAGLEPGQTDFGDLGYDYDVVELVTEALSQGLSEEDMKNHDQIRSIVAPQIERYQSLFGRAKHETVAEVIDDIIWRHQGARAKMQIIHPPTPKVSLIYQ